VVEVEPAEEVFSRPKHPYTKLLADSAPVVVRALKVPEGRETELPDPLKPPPGCAFAARCAFTKSICSKKTPGLKGEKGEAQVACFNPSRRSGYGRLVQALTLWPYHRIQHLLNINFIMRRYS
jgi:peptide/nickel transport system ATP-binding protein